MSKYKVFISSVQSEFSKERQLVFDFIRNDELMGQYFEPFIFEQIAAQDANPRQLYLDEASSSQVYLLLMGKRYGNVLPDGVSPTEKEYQAAGMGNAWRVAFISDLDGQQREEAEERFFRKVQNELSYRVFSNPSVLVSLVKQSLYAYLKYKGVIQTLSFDEQTRDDASMDDIDATKIKDFLHQARQKRGFPLAEDSDPVTVLRHLRLLRQDKPSNGALLMFANDPQYFFPSAVVKCAWFLGTETVKPIEDYKTFEGGVADQISQATSWVMSKCRCALANETRRHKTRPNLRYRDPSSSRPLLMLWPIATTTAQGVCRFQFFATVLWYVIPGRCLLNSPRPT